MISDFMKKFDEQLKCETNVCGGFKACIDRTCDKTQSDCQECIEDSTKAIEELNSLSWDELFGGVISREDLPEYVKSDYERENK